MSRRLRILVLAPSVSDPPTWGSAMRTNQLLRHLAARHEVTLAHYARAAQREALETLRGLCAAAHSIEPGRPFDDRKRWKQLSRLGSARSYWFWSRHSSAMQDLIDRLVGETAFDIIQMESSQMACFRLPRSRALRVLNEHNIEYETLRRMAVTEASPRRRLYNALEWGKLRREERAAWRRFDGCAVPSEREAQIVRQAAPKTPTAVVANGADLDHFRPAAGPVEPHSIVFTGHLGYRPNTDAVLYFVRDVLPMIRRECPDARLTVVGMEGQEALGSLAGPNVAITGRVPDVRPYLARAAVVVAPIRMGSGTRLKVIEALAMAKPLVSTGLGAEGLALQAGEHYLRADAPAVFARQVVWLLAHPGEAEQLGRRGRQRIESEYGWSAIGGRLEAWYQDLLGRDRSSREQDRPDRPRPGRQVRGERAPFDQREEAEGT